MYINRKLFRNATKLEKTEEADKNGKSFSGLTEALENLKAPHWLVVFKYFDVFCCACNVF